MLRWPVDPVRAVAARSLPEPGRTAVAYEMKWDGFRAVIWRTADGVRIQSRHGTDLTRYFPDLQAPLTAALPPRSVIDGEVLVWDTDHGRCSFSLLQRRLTAGRRLAEVVRQHPAHFVAFDLLRDGRGVELLDQPLTMRRAKLERLLRGAPAPFAVCPQTDDLDVAHGWLSELGVAGVEGVVVKPVAGRYQPGCAGVDEGPGHSDRRLRHRRGHRLAGLAGLVAARPLRRPRCPALRRADPSDQRRAAARTGGGAARGCRSRVPAPVTRGRARCRPPGRPACPAGAGAVHAGRADRGGRGGGRHRAGRTVRPHPAPVPSRPGPARPAPQRSRHRQPRRIRRGREQAMTLHQAQ